MLSQLTVFLSLPALCLGMVVVADPEPNLPQPTIGAGAGAEFSRKEPDAEQSVDGSVLQQAVKAYNAQDFHGALRILERASHQNRHPVVFNVRGAVLTELRRYDEAGKWFQKALALAPQHFWARFNMSELQFLQGSYSRARDMFLAMKPAGKREDELLDLKIVLTYLKTDDTAGASAHADKMPFPADTAAWYAAQAAVAFQSQDRAKALAWLAESERVFPGQLEGFLMKTMREAGMDFSMDEIGVVPAPVVVVPPENSREESFTLDPRTSDYLLVPSAFDSGE